MDACPCICGSSSRSPSGGTTTISSQALARAAGVNSAKVRKDLSYLGSYGTRGVGYDVAYLMHQVRRELGLTQDWPVLIAGAGNLGHALANYRGFEERGFRVVAIVDVDPRTVGERIGGLLVQPPGRPAGDRPASTTSRSASSARRPRPPRRSPTGWCAAGLRSILNFAPALVTLPQDVSVRRVDLSIELQILAYYEQRKAALESVAAGRGSGGTIWPRFLAAAGRVEPGASPPAGCHVSKRPARPARAPGHRRRRAAEGLPAAGG